jgi:hypothetical protein
MATLTICFLSPTGSSRELLFWAAIRGIGQLSRFADHAYDRVTVGPIYSSGLQGEL